MAQMTDEEIVALVQKGDKESFGLLVERYEAKMTRYGRRFLSNSSDIEDLVQNVFLKVYTNIQGFNTKQRFSPWIYRIAHNEFVNALRKKKREPLYFFGSDTLFPHPVAKENTDKKANVGDLKKMLDRCLDKLDAKYREPLVLYYFEEMSYRDIAEILHIPVSTVGVRLNRGREALGNIYNKLDIHGG